jgi:hypothetical protein
MVYLVGIIGFIGGFIVGQLLLSYLLRAYSREEIFELMKDIKLKFLYGSLNWLMAAAGAAGFIAAYQRYFWQ